MIKQFFLTILLAQFSIALFSSTAFAQAVFDFEELQLPGEGFFNGDPTQQVIDTVVTSDTPNPFPGALRQVDQTILLSQGGVEITLPNSYFEADGFDDFFFDFSFSNVRDSISPGPDNRYASCPGAGANGSSNYLVASGATSFTASGTITSIDIAPTTFTAIAILNGDDGGGGFLGGSLPDLNGFFNLIISGNNSADQIIVPFGDYRNSANIAPSESFQTIDVSSLNSNTLSFDYEGDDVDSNDFVNTPAFFAADNIVVAVPEPNTFGFLLAIGGAASAFRRRRRS